MLLILMIGVALVAGGFLLALVSEEFAYALSRVVEAVIEFVEYKTALKQARTQSRQARLQTLPDHSGRLIYHASYSRTA